MCDGTCLCKGLAPEKKVNTDAQIVGARILCILATRQGEKVERAVAERAMKPLSWEHEPKDPVEPPTSRDWEPRKPEVPAKETFWSKIRARTSD